MIDVQRALDLRAAGTPWKDIGEEVGATLRQLSYLCDLAGVQRRPIFKLTDEMKDEIRALRAKGVSWVQIECKYGLSWKQIQRRINGY